MILATVGDQMPFDRLLRALDAWAGAHPGRDILAQTGPTAWTPAHMRWARSLPPRAFRAALASAEAVVAHAGMGTILLALEHGTPILVMPRRGALRETRNDHQVATATALRDRPGVIVAPDEAALPEAMRHLGALVASRAVRPSIEPHASPRLLETLRRFVVGDAPSLALPAAPAAPALRHAA